MTTKELLISNNFKFSHSLGQNFITDINLLDAITQDADINKTDTVLEIGVGAATLTRSLALAADRVVGYEIDTKLTNIINATLEGINNVDIIYKDILRCSIDEIEGNLPINYKVVANLPYYITTPIIMLFVEQSTKVNSLTIMVQKEVAQRITASSGTKDYSAVTVAIAAVCQVSLLRNVNRKAFHPVPNVDSSVIRLDFNKDTSKIICRNTFRKVVRASFSMRRKTLLNNLVTSLNLTREAANDLIINLDVDINIRSECLTIEQFITLSNNYYKLIKTNNNVN